MRYALRSVLRPVALVWILFIAAAPSGVYAADKPEFAPAPSWITPVALPPDETAPDDAPVRILLTDWQFRFSQSGDEAFVRSVMRIQTTQGLAQVGTIAVPWNPATDLLTIHELHIRRGAEVLDVLANGQTFTVLRRENSLEYAVLNGVLTAVIQPAGLQVGDILELAFTITRRSDVLAGVSERFVAGWPPVPISHIRVRGVWTQPTTVHWKASDSMTGVHETRNGSTTEVTVVRDNVAPTILKNAPARYRLGPWIEFSSFRSWGEIAERLGPLYEQAATLPAQSPLRAEIARIRSAAPDPAARALAALRLVQDQVRYVYLGMNDGALVPAGADLTWSRRFGDCKGKTGLLLALLRGLDIDAEPVAVNVLNGDNVGSSLPMVEAFDHVLVRATIGDKVYWLDGARSGDRRLEDLSAPPYYWGLPLVAKHADLLRIPQEPLVDPLDETRVNIDASSGKKEAVLHVDAILRGQAAALMRLALGNLAPEAREQALREIWKSWSATKIDKVGARFDEPTAREYLTLDGSIELQWDDGKLPLRRMALAYTADLTRESGPDHDVPVSVAFPTYSRTIETIVLPPTQAPFTVEGDDVDKTIEGVEFHRRLRIDNHVLTATASERTLIPEIPYAVAQKELAALHELTASEVYVRAPAEYVRSLQPATSGLPNFPNLVASLPGAALPGNPPDVAEVNRLIAEGNTALNKSDFDHAIASLDRALTIDSKSDLALADRGLTYAWKGDREHARQDLDAAEAIDARNPVVPRGRGVLALLVHNYNEAIADFSSSLKLDPANAFSLTERAQAYRSTGHGDEALADIDELIRLRPTRVQSYVFRAELLRERGRTDEALKEADAVVLANPSSAEAYIAAAAIYRWSGMDAAATSSLDKATAIAPSAQTYLVRASYRAKDDISDRRADVQAALALEPQSVSALAMLANVESDAKLDVASLATLGKAIALGGETASLLAMRGIVHWRIGDHEDAQKDFSAARAKATDPPSLNSLCWRLATAGIALDVALNACDAALALQPDTRGYLDSRGLVLLRAGRYEDAIKSYDGALKEYPTAVSLYGRGIAKGLKGEKAAGDADLQAALRLDAHIAADYADFGVKR